MSSIYLLTLDLLGGMPCYRPLARRAAYAAQLGLIDWSAIEELQELVNNHLAASPVAAFASLFAEILAKELESRERRCTELRKFQPSYAARRDFLAASAADVREGRIRPIKGVIRHFQAAAAADAPHAPYVRRLNKRRDLRRILEIERAGFEFPWSEQDFTRCLRQGGGVGFVAELRRPVGANALAGYLIFERAVECVHVLNVAVDQQCRRRGVGRALLGTLMARLRRRSFMDWPDRFISCEVRETNADALQFFQTLGFKAVSVLRDYYDDTPEDAYVMQYRHVPNQA